MRKKEVLAILIIMGSIFAGAFYYPQMPSEMKVHWGSDMETGETMSKGWAVFMFPVLSSFVWLLFKFFRRADPLRTNIELFQDELEVFLTVLIGLITYLQAITILWNTGLRFNIAQLTLPAVSALLFMCGVVLDSAKRNWFFGIRTPWTLSSEEVWRKTHNRGALLFKILALTNLGAIFFPDLIHYFLTVPLILVSAYLLAYSYIEYSRKSVR